MCWCWVRLASRSVSLFFCVFAAWKQRGVTLVLCAASSGMCSGMCGCGVCVSGLMVTQMSLRTTLTWKQLMVRARVWWRAYRSCAASA